MIFADTYDIQRFWCPTDGTIGLDQRGYLKDPLTYTVWEGQPDSVPFDRIQDVPVLVLLGEPGMGKSQWFKDAQSSMTNTIHEKGHTSLWIDLNRFETATEAVNAVFGHAVFREWAHRQYCLHLFLDSFDECHSRSSVLLQKLLYELRQIPRERLFLRVLCRTAEWPPTMESGLKDLWHKPQGPEDASPMTKGIEPGTTARSSNPSVQKYELAPLRRQDVIKIIQGEGIDSQSFLREVESRDIVPFSARPQTLAFLVKTYQGDGSLPSSQVELYREGCRLLCCEPNQERIDGGLVSQYSPDQLLATASRIAAFSVFGGRHSIVQREGFLTDVKAHEISPRDVCHGYEEIRGQHIAVGEDIFRDALKTGLFTARPGGRMGWAHQTYAEFLAADYLCHNGVPADQVMILLRNPHAPTDRVPPQLSEAAAWLALMNESVFESLLEVDPEILLRKARIPDPRMRERAVREKLVGNLLRLLDGNEILDNRISGIPLDGLRYPGLEDHLREHISDRTKNYVVRRVAIRMAEDNGVQELQDAICEVAINPDDDYLVRETAARALVSIADERVKARLKPLAVGVRDDDPEDELKGAALIALWPDHITAEELFDNLTRPKRPNSLGSYQLFLGQFLLQRMQPSHLPTALDWIQRQPRDQGASFSFKEIIDSIMRLAYDHLEDPAIFQQFAGAALHRLQEFEEIIPSGSGGREDNILFRDDVMRQSLFRRMLSLAAESEDCDGSDAVYLVNLTEKQDLPWLIDLYLGDLIPGAKLILARIIGRFFNPGNQQQFEMLFELSRTDQALASALRPTLGPVDLESEEADRMRRYFLVEQRRTPDDKIQGTRPPCSQDAIAGYLSEIEAGNVARFCALVRQMIDPERDSEAPEPLPTDLTGLQCWGACEEATRQRVAAAAKRYVLECDPHADQWLGTRNILWQAWTGYIALRLLLQVESSSFAELPTAVWIKWSPAIVACWAGPPEPESDTPLVEAYRRVPDEIIAHVLHQIDYENRASEWIWITRRLGAIWDTRLTQAILDKLDDPMLKPGSTESLLEALYAHAPAAAVNFAKAQLVVPLPEPGPRQTMALAAAKLLMLQAPEGFWPVVWPALDGERLFGRSLMSFLARHAYSGLGRAFQAISEEELANWFAWISREYPQTEEGASDRVLHAVTPRHIGERILRQLEDRGTIESVRALEDLCKRLPERADSLRWGLEAAKDRALAATWIPWTPEDIFSMVKDPEKRAVPGRSGAKETQTMIESKKKGLSVDGTFALLHLSDLHFGAEGVAADWKADAEVWAKSLLDDLKKLTDEPVGAVVVSGDIADKAREAEYDAAETFFTKIGDKLGVPRESFVIVPGNHDVDWEASKRGFKFVDAALVTNHLDKTRAIDLGPNQGCLTPELPDYGRRFEEFSAFYTRFTGKNFPSADYEAQWDVQDFPDPGVVIVGLNSAWDVNHKQPDWVRIHRVARTKALERLEGISEGRLKICVWHHPPTGSDECRLKDDDLLEQLSQSGFRMILHGHLHKGTNLELPYNRKAGGTRIELIGLGAFGSNRPARGYPYQYNLVQMSGKTVRVDTRMRTGRDAPWLPHAIWKSKSGGSSTGEAFYEFEL